MKHGREERKRRSNASYKNLITKWLQKLALNYRVEIFDEEIDFFLDNLVTWTNFQIDIAFDRCMTECLFFPKLKEVLERMPEDRAAHGPIKTCQACEPDGWRIVPHPDGGGYQQLIRCDHKPEYIRYPFTREQLQAIWNKLPDWARQAATPGLHKTERPPRFPHLIGKGIKYGNVSTKLPAVKPDESTQK